MHRAIFVVALQGQTGNAGGFLSPVHVWLKEWLMPAGSEGMEAEAGRDVCQAVHP